MQICTLANSENLDEMWHSSAFHQGLHALFAKINRGYLLFMRNNEFNR